MDKSYFTTVMGGIFAAFQKPSPRGAVVDEAFTPVADYPDDFIDWAAARLKDEDKLPVNIGRELKRMWPAYKAETTPAVPFDPHANENAGDPHCPDCGGIGWHYVWRRGNPSVAPTAVPCRCNAVVDRWENPPRKASLEDLRRSGIWTLRQPPVIRDRPPVPLRKSLQEVMASLRAGAGIPEDACDPRRQMPGEYA